jgi:hypothetical protein
MKKANNTSLRINVFWAFIVLMLSQNAFAQNQATVVAANTGVEYSQYRKFITTFNNKMYFFVKRDSFFQIWESDGTTIGTKQRVQLPALKHVQTQLVVFKGALYFILNDFRDFRDPNIRPVEIWRFDGTNAQLVQTIEGNGYLDPRVTVTNNAIYFTVNSPITTVFRFTGVLSETRPLFAAGYSNRVSNFWQYAVYNYGDNYSYIIQRTATYNNTDTVRLFSQAVNSAASQQLYAANWRSTNFFPSPKPIVISPIGQTNDDLIAFVNDTLMRITPNGDKTILLFGKSCGFVAHQNGLTYFSVRNLINPTLELWRTDGTVANTKKIPLPPNETISDFNTATIFQRTLYVLKQSGDTLKTFKVTENATDCVLFNTVNTKGATDFSFVEDDQLHLMSIGPYGGFWSLVSNQWQLTSKGRTLNQNGLAKLGSDFYYCDYSYLMKLTTQLDTTTGCNRDTIPPTLTNCPRDTTIFLSNRSYSTVHWTPPTVTDNCSTNISLWGSERPDTTTFYKGKSLVTYTAIDEKGNFSLCRFTVTITGPPDSACQVTRVENTGRNCAPNYGILWGIDSANNYSVVESISGSPEVYQTTYFQKKAGDSCTFYHDYRYSNSKNSIQRTLYLTFSNKQNAQPRFGSCFSPTSTNDWSYYSAVNGILSYWVGGYGGDRFSTDTIVGVEGFFQYGRGANNEDANDNGGNAVLVTNRGKRFLLAFKTGVTVNCVDGCGLNDRVPPFLGQCPVQDTIISTNTNCAVVNWTKPDYRDNCSSATLTTTHQPNDCYPVGTTRVTCTATDASNLSTSCSFDIKVVNPLFPSNLPDLTVTNLAPRDPSVQSGRILSFSFDAKNLGLGNVPNNFKVKSYLSTDRYLDRYDYQDGTIPTANYPAGTTIAQIQGAMRVSNSLVLGNYYLILKIDADDEIEESNEYNNVLISANTIAIVPFVNTCRYDDSLQLVRLYHATNGGNWTRQWNLNAPINTWYGITLNSEGCVSIINIQTNSLVGTIPDNLSFSQLSLLFLSNNRLSGAIPSFNLPSLTGLYLGNNQLSGGVPTFSNSRGLQQIILAENQLSGTIPNFNLPNLSALYLYKNQLTGTIPNFSQTSLRQLLLFNNQLSGPIPNFNAFNMESIVLSFNQLTGTIPSFNCPNLTSLIISNNQLSGAIPSFDLPNLTTLRLNDNRLSGCLPASLRIYCGKDVEIGNNPNLATQNFTAFCSANNTGQCGTAVASDIALSISGDPSVYRPFTTHNFTISAINTGSAAFSDVKIKFPFPTKTVSGGTPIASFGSFQEWCTSGQCFEWTIPNLPANTTATLLVPLYVLDAVGGMTATTNLVSSTPVDNNAVNNTASVIINRAGSPPPFSVPSKPTASTPIFLQKLNPTMTEHFIVVEIESNVNQSIDFQIVNALGTVVLTNKLNVEQGNNKLNFNVEQLPKGLYFIQTSLGNGSNIPMKFVKM